MNYARRTMQATALLGIMAAVFAWHANAEAWCPFGGVEALYTYMREGNLVCSLAISNFYAMLALVGSVLLVRRAFCGYLCPIGTISQWLRAAARRLGLTTLPVSATAERLLASIKYAIVGLIVVVTWQAGELLFRGYCPAYALLSRHGEDITYWAYVVAGAIAVGSLFVAMPFCRWLCPLAAVLNPLSRYGLARIKRDEGACVDCGRCARACPMAIPVDRLEQVTASRCLSCMKCVESCPRASALSWGPPDRIGRAWPRGAVIGVVLLCAGAAVAMAYVAPVPSFVKSHGVPPAETAEVELRIADLTCRGRANLLVGFLERTDLYRISGGTAGSTGYYRLEAWPAPRIATVRIRFDPAYTDAEAIKAAITEPYYDAGSDRWWLSPFAIEGYTTPGLD